MGPLAGLKIVEFAGIGAGPYCAMMLAEMGAEVVRVDRPAPAGLGVEVEAQYDLLLRSRPSVAIDLKAEAPPSANSVPGGRRKLIAISETRRASRFPERM
jgi:crotonobetainyl-CoA:carnitine CoA-transferase CaiB-like acyl-CoA transferase